MNHKKRIIMESVGIRKLLKPQEEDQLAYMERGSQPLNGPKPQTLPVAEKTYFLKELYIETIIRNPKESEKARSFRLQVNHKPHHPHGPQIRKP